MLDNKFYVYAHYTKDTNELFYIGKGCGKRHLSSCDRNPKWERIVNKHGFYSIILTNNLAEDYAYFQEYLGIRELKPRANLVDGGLGFTSSELKKKWENEEYRRNMSIKRKKIWENEEHKASRISKIKKTWENPELRKISGEKISKSLTGRKPSPSTIEKIRNINLGRKHSFERNLRIATTLGSAAFLVFKKDTGEFVGEWTNKSQCARDLGLTRSLLCRYLDKKSGFVSHKGYIFEYKK